MTKVFSPYRPALAALLALIWAFQALPALAADGAAHRLPPGLEGGQCHPDRLSGRTVGLIIGATLGAAIGAGASSDEDRAFGTALGAVIGAVIGKKIGRALSPDSKACIGETLEYAADDQTITWHDPDAKLDYALTPTKSATDSAGKACRDYIIKASDETTSKTADGSACRYGDNAWQIVD
jgi:surface antigen